MGAQIRYDLNFETHIGTLVGKLHNRIHQVRTVTKFTTFHTRLSFMNAHIIGSLNYIIPLYLNLNINLLNKLHKVLMTAARATIGSYCFKKSKIYILNKCKWLDIKQMINYASLKFIHKIVVNKKPNSITLLYKNILTRRAVVNVTSLYKPKYKKMKVFIIYNGLAMYNNLPNSLRLLNVKRYNIQLRKYIISNNISDTMD